MIIVLGVDRSNRAGAGHGHLVRVARSHLGGGRGSSPHVLAPVQFDQHGQPISAKRMLGEEVRRIFLAWDFAQIHAAEADRLLDPQGVRIKVAQFAKTSPVANTDRGAAVCPDAQG